MYRPEVKLIPDKDIIFDCEEFEIHKRRLFRYAGKSTVVTIPNGITEIGANSFYGRSKIEEIILPETVVTISSHAFSECRSLRKINLPEGLKVIDQYAFKGCRALCDVIFPSTLEVICRDGFKFCESLRELILPKGLRKIHSNAFLACTNLESVTILDYDNLLINPTAFNECNKLCIYANFSVRGCISTEHPNRIAFAAGFLKMLRDDIEPSEGQRILSLFLLARYGSSDVSEKNLGADTLRNAFRRVIIEKGLANRYDITNAMLDEHFEKDAEVMTKLIEQKRKLVLSSDQDDLTLE